MRFRIFSLIFFLCACTTEDADVSSEVPQETPVVETEEVAEAVTGCQSAKNVCPDYSVYWVEVCPESKRCLSFHNASETETVSLSYQIGCNGDGTRGAPQCDCTAGPELKPGTDTFFVITDGDYESCLPSWQPPCLTAGLAVMANTEGVDCTKGTRIGLSAGNKADDYGKFDSYDIDVEKDFYSIPVSFAPDLDCAVDHASHDCRPLWCGSADCPDAYGTPTTGACKDDRSPQAGCQDSFGQSKGYTVTLFPADCTAESCPSCQDAKPCE